MQVAGPPTRCHLFTLLTRSPFTSWRCRRPGIPDAREVRAQRIEPDIHRLRVVAGYGHAPGKAGAGTRDGEVWEDGGTQSGGEQRAEDEGVLRGRVDP